MISKPIETPMRGDPMRASWGAAVADRANECADAIDELRGPGAIISRREPKAALEPSLYPLKVRWVPSQEENATPIDGDLIVYVPAGSLSVNGNGIAAEDVPLDPYTAGGYQDVPDWYILPAPQGNVDVTMSFSFRPGDDEAPLSITFTLAASGAVSSWSDEPGEINRDITLAQVTVVQPAEGVAGGVTVRQITKGPLVYEFGVRSLNGAMGDLNVVGDPEGVTLAYGDGEGGGVLIREYHIKVKREEESSDIVVSLKADEDEEDDPGYCNAISDDGGGGDTPSNDISNDDTNDHNQGSGTNGEPGAAGGNAISLWPCKKEAA